MISSTQLFYFSPTHTTKKVLKSFAQGLNCNQTVFTDLTHHNLESTQLEKTDLIVVGLPVYSGRLPDLALERIQQLQASGTPTVAFVVYGNRDFDDALLELTDFLKSKGCLIIAAFAFIGEHSFSTDEFPVALNRPDGADLDLALQWGKKVQENFSELKAQASSLEIPGKRPYKEKRVSNPVVPIVDESLCTECSACANACPTGAIQPEKHFAADPALCIRCAACIKVCRELAREFLDPQMIELTKRLSATCQTRREPVFFSTVPF